MTMTLKSKLLTAFFALWLPVTLILLVGGLLGLWLGHALWA